MATPPTGAVPGTSTDVKDLQLRLDNISTALGSHTLSMLVPDYQGETGKFQEWISALEKFAKIIGLDDSSKKLAALQTSKGAVSQFIFRFLESSEQDKPWSVLKTQLSVRFGETRDNQHAFSILKNMKQKKDENVQLFAERVLCVAEKAFPTTESLTAFESHLVGIFVDGLINDFIRMKVLRDRPNTLQSAAEIATDEQNLQLRFIRGKPRGQPAVRPEEEDMEVDAAKKAKVTCYRCLKPGHKASECHTKVVAATSCVKCKCTCNEGNKDSSEGRACFYCKEVGHLIKDCPKLQAKKLREEQQGNE